MLDVGGQGSGGWWLGIRDWMLDVGCSTAGVGCWILDAGVVVGFGVCDGGCGDGVSVKVSVKVSGKVSGKV